MCALVEFKPRPSTDSVCTPDTRPPVTPDTENTGQIRRPAPVCDSLSVCQSVCQCGERDPKWRLHMTTLYCDIVMCIKICVIQTKTSHIVLPCVFLLCVTQITIRHTPMYIIIGYFNNHQSYCYVYIYHLSILSWVYVSFEPPPAIRICTYLNTKMYVSLYTFSFSRLFRNRLDCLWHKVSFCSWESSEKIILLKKRVIALFLYFFKFSL